MKVFMRYLVIALLGYGMSGVLGCVSIKEAARGVAGTSTKILEEKRKDAAKKVFVYDYNTCYSKVKEVLEKAGSYIYREDSQKQLIAIYISQEDTTPVGIFFQAQDNGNTQVEVSSPSTYAKEFISEKIFSGLKEAARPEAKEGETNEKK